jgi:hypothetical protein
LFLQSELDQNLPLSGLVINLLKISPPSVTGFIGGMWHCYCSAGNYFLLSCSRTSKWSYSTIRPRSKTDLCSRVIRRKVVTSNSVQPLLSTLNVPTASILWCKCIYVEPLRLSNIKTIIFMSKSLSAPKAWMAWPSSVKIRQTKSVRGLILQPYSILAMLSQGRGNSAS